MPALRPTRLPSPRTLRLAFALAVLGLAGAIAGGVIASHSGSSRETPVEWRDLSHGIGTLTGFGAPTRHVFRRQANYEGYIAEHLGTVIPVAYPDEMVVLFAAGPRSTPAYRLTVEGVVRKRGAIRVRIRELTPGVADRTPSRLTFPYIAISIPWTRTPVSIEWLGRQ